mgnify:CR=1 FL=1
MGAASIEFRRIYAPADRIQAWPRDAVRYVPIDAQDFESMVRQAHANRQAQPDTGAQILAAEYRAALDGDTLSGELDWNIKLAGAERIIALDLSEGRLEEARHHGATDLRIADADTVQWIRDETGGYGADYTFEATGLVAVMGQAVEAAREAWGLATMCGVAGKGDLLQVVPRLLITGRRVTGSSFGGVKGRTQLPGLVDRWLAGEFDAMSLVSHRMGLDQVNEGFHLMEAQDGIRSVIQFS